MKRQLLLLLTYASLIQSSTINTKLNNITLHPLQVNRKELATLSTLTLTSKASYNNLTLSALRAQIIPEIKNERRINSIISRNYSKKTHTNGGSGFLMNNILIYLDKLSAERETECIKTEPIYHIFGSGAAHEKYNEMLPLTKYIKADGVNNYGEEYYILDNPQKLESMLNSIPRDIKNQIANENIEIVAINQLYEKIVNTLIYCNENNINIFSFIFSKENKILVDIIIKAFNENNIFLNTNVIFIENTNDIEALCRKLINNEPIETMQINNKELTKFITNNENIIRTLLKICESILSTIEDNARHILYDTSELLFIFTSIDKKNQYLNENQKERLKNIELKMNSILLSKLKNNTSESLINDIHNTTNKIIDRINLSLEISKYINHDEKENCYNEFILIICNLLKECSDISIKNNNLYTLFIELIMNAIKKYHTKCENNVVLSELPLHRIPNLLHDYPIAKSSLFLMTPSINPNAFQENIYTCYLKNKTYTSTEKSMYLINLLDTYKNDYDTLSFIKLLLKKFTALEPNEENAINNHLNKIEFENIRLRIYKKKSIKKFNNKNKMHYRSTIARKSFQNISDLFRKIIAYLPTIY